MAESEEELKSLLMKVKEVSEKVGLKFNIPLHHSLLPWGSKAQSTYSLTWQEQEAQDGYPRMHDAIGLKERESRLLGVARNQMVSEQVLILRLQLLLSPLQGESHKPACWK